MQERVDQEELEENLCFEVNKLSLTNSLKRKYFILIGCLFLFLNCD